MNVLKKCPLKDTQTENKRMREALVLIARTALRECVWQKDICAGQYLVICDTAMAALADTDAAISWMEAEKQRAEKMARMQK